MSAVDERGIKLWTGKTLSDPDAIWHSIKPWANNIELISLEASEYLLSEWIFAGLRDAGQNGRCIETRHAQRFLSTRPNKTDRNDADGIAQMMRFGHFNPVHLKSQTSQGIQTIIAAHAQIVSAMVRLELTGRGLIIKFGLKISYGGRVSFAERVRVAIANDNDLCIAIIRFSNPARPCDSRNLVTTALSMHCQKSKAMQSADVGYSCWSSNFSGICCSH